MSEAREVPKVRIGSRSVAKPFHVEHSVQRFTVIDVKTGADMAPEWEFGFPSGEAAREWARTAGFWIEGEA